MNRKPLTVEVADKIIEMIKEEKFLPGSRLPNEFELSSMLSVSRGTVREAIKQLVSRNILEIRRGNGTFVCKQMGVTEDPIGLQFFTDRKKLALDLCEVRMMLEPVLVAKAAERATEEEIAEMQRLGDLVTDKIHRGETHYKEDIDLHVYWANCTHNEVLPKILPILMEGISINVTITNRALTEQTITNHQAIIDAIRERDGKKAAEYMRLHIQRNIDYIIQNP